MNRSENDSEQQSSSLEFSRRSVLLQSIAGALAIPTGVMSAPQSARSELAQLETKRRRFGENERIFDTKSGSFLPPRADRLLANGRFNSRLLLVGEIHTHPLHHRIQLDLIKSLHRSTLQNRQPMAIGFEHFYRQHQAYLDAFIDGRVSLSKLIQLTKWSETFGFDIALWTPILRYARANHIRLIGLNVPIGVARLVSQRGLENLPHQLLDLLPEIDLTNASHRARFEVSINGAHGGMNDEMKWKYYQTVALWDEYMAESASRYLHSEPEGVLTVLAGAAHIEGRTGIPDRITKRTGIKSFTVLPQSVNWTVDLLPAIDQPKGRDTADWLWYTQREIDLV